MYQEEKLTEVFETPKPPTVVVDLFSGSIRAMGHADGSVEANVTKRAGGRNAELAQEHLNDILVEFKQSDDEVLITAQRSGGLFSTRDLSANVELLKVPFGATLKFNTSFGSVSIENVAGAIDVQTGNGSITVVDSAGDLVLRSDLGKLTVSGESSNVKATTSNGSVHIKQTAPATIDLRSNLGAIEVDSEHKLKLTARTDNGKIEVKAGHGSELEVTTSYGAIDIAASDSRIVARTDNGSIKSTGPLGGNLELRTSFGSMEILGTDTRVIAHSDHGSISFTGTLGKGENKLQSHFGAINLRLPADAQLAVDASTNHGGIVSDFELKVSDQLGAKKLHGTIGADDASKVELHTDHGGIQILREPSTDPR